MRACKADGGFAAVAQWFKAKGLLPGFDSSDVWRHEHQVALKGTRMLQVHVPSETHQAVGKGDEGTMFHGEFANGQRERAGRLAQLPAFYRRPLSRMYSAAGRNP